MPAVIVANTPAVRLYDSAGVEMAVQNGVATPVGTRALLIAGSDGATSRFIRTATDGTVRTDPSGTTTQPISAASLPLPTGAATSALQTQPGVDIGDVTVNNGAGASAVNVQDGGNSLTVDTTQLPAALVGARLDTNTGAWLGSTAPTVGQKAMASSVPVVLASDQSALPVTTATSATATHSNVASSITNVTLLASNAARKGATVYNDSTKNLFVKLGATASASSFMVKLDAGGYLEVPFSYTGVIDGIWDVANGSARVVEFT